MNESVFLTNDEGKPLCTRCNIKPIVTESIEPNGTHSYLCLSCATDDYNDADEDLIEGDDSLIFCERELELQTLEGEC